MNVIDSVPAHSLDESDEGTTVISLNDDEIVIHKIGESEIDRVSFTGYSMTHDSVEAFEIDPDTMIDILGA